MAKAPKAILCPYCGLMQAQPSSDDSGADSGGVQRCSACGGLFDPLSRKATQISMGPWYIRDRANPFRPGCCWEVLKRQIAAGRIKPTTVLRGPTTRQFWAIARNVPGVSHLLGYCHRCGEKVKATDVACPECAEPFIEPSERNELGLVYATQSAAEAAYKQLEKEIDGDMKPSAESKSASRHEPARKPKKAAADAVPHAKGHEEWQPGLDLLDEVIGGPGDFTPAVESRGASRKAAAAAPALKLGAGLDFTPSDDVDDADVAAALTAGPTPAYAPQNRNTQIVVWLLVAVNLLLLPILVGALLYFLGVFNQDESVTQPSARQQTSMFEDEPDPLAPAPTATLPARPMVAPTPPVQETQPIAPPAAVTNPVTPTEVVNAITAALAEAQRLEEAGELTSALTLLQDVQRKSRPADRPADLDARIRRLQDRIDRAETADFFGLPSAP